jgi:hypothetical protein
MKSSSAALLRSFDTPSTFLTTLDDFPRDSLPSKAISTLYKHFYHHLPSSLSSMQVKPPNHNKYIIHKHKDESWLSGLNPFECDSDYSDSYEWVSSVSNQTICLFIYLLLAPTRTNISRNANQSCITNTKPRRRRRRRNFSWKLSLAFWFSLHWKWLRRKFGHFSQL